MSVKQDQLVFGVGRNDAEYPVTSKVGGKHLFGGFHER